jgi:tetratricopeptide (TPR) repeat protein
MNVREFIERGNEYFSNSKYQKALNYYTQAINTISDADNLEELFQTNESFHKCFANRAKCYLELKEYVNSLDDANIVLSIYPDDKNILFVLSQIYKELKQYEKALDYANRLDSNSDLNVYLNELNGLIKEKLMQLEIKKKDIKKLLTSKILDAEVNFLIIILYNVAKIIFFNKIKSIKLVLGMLKDEEFSDGCKDEVIECLNTLIETVKKTNQTKSIKKGIMQIFAEICKKSSQKV